MTWRKVGRHYPAWYYYPSPDLDFDEWIYKIERQSIGPVERAIWGFCIRIDRMSWKTHLFGEEELDDWLTNWEDKLMERIL